MHSRPKLQAEQGTAEEEEGLTASLANAQRTSKLQWRFYLSALDGILTIEKRTWDASLGRKGVLALDCRCQEFILTRQRSVPNISPSRQQEASS